MRALTLPRFGGPELLEPADLPVPEPGPGQLLVKVLACGINPVDAKIRRGALDLPFSFQLVLGYDVSGVVEAVGEEVQDFAAGDEVYFSQELTENGGYAEYTCVKEEVVAFKPVGLSHVEAASVPIAGMTAWQALFDRAGVVSGEAVLVHGGAGGVGSLAVQLASWAGAEVFATAGPRNQAFLEELGADLCLDYTRQNFVEEVLYATAGEGVEVVLDTVGGQVLLRSLEALAQEGRLVAVVPENLGGLSLEGLRAGFFRNVEIHLHFMERRRETLDALARLLERGFLQPVVDRVIPLDPEAVADAHRRMDGGHGRGKVVIQMERT